jgi:hypothetical protein
VKMQRQHLEEAGWTKTAISRFLPPPTVTQHTYGKQRYITHTWEAAAVLAALQQEECRAFFARLQARRDKEPALPETIDVLTATQEASRAAHRWRDAGSAQYEAGNYGLASTSSANKRHFYRLKDQGIVHLHKTGVLPYIGASPQGWLSTSTGTAACLASTPRCIRWGRSVRRCRTILRCSRCPQRREVRIADVEHTLGCLPAESDGYERSASPKFARPQRTCFECGEPGHIARFCPMREHEAIDLWDDFGTA